MVSLRYKLIHKRSERPHNIEFTREYKDQRAVSLNSRRSVDVLMKVCASPVVLRLSHSDSSEREQSTAALPPVDTARRLVLLSRLDSQQF
ncbi:UNVERIFIED_CONTAM: hypothetical protein FKN15_024349 [Acipenser sinensis]